MSPTRAEQAEKTRKAVLDTARRLFVEHGFDATSLQLIADTMGVTKANVYYYFRTKIEILEALLDVSIAAFDAMLDTAETIRGKRARMEYLVDGFVDQVIANRAIAPLSHTDPGLRRHDRIRRTLDAQAERGLHLLFGDQPTAEEQAAYFMANDLGPAIRRLSHRGDDELRETLKRLCLRLLRV
ncbi:TetR/AcrR family transcriptional regulator [Nonomuraea aurantiaca]|uniref:TetR/AcrR family transcriptional regulator n=1 Tax=Nonomuraea aurantiaca TaxID=2878562 RepID=UPI001CD98A17|nr:TetR/AcrR family transcriptional regulator [Nonomuraea aurantiaca]MCA2228354.1 TetR/AcrR family transcriptional regulator [Nonomuraea aurantiaca]